MKKMLSLIACLSVFCMAFFAQSQPEAYDKEDPFAEEEFYAKRTEVDVIVPEDQNWEDKNAKVRIEFHPMYDSAYVIYETLSVTFDRGQANNAVIATAEKFAKENNYDRHYDYIREDREQYARGDVGDKTIYISQIKFRR